jgi:branched-chain amino acid transport system ATP-binding protein
VAEPTKEALLIRDLRGYYGPVEVLHQLSLDVAEGEIVALIGPNGAGKTSLLRAVSGELRIRGEVTYRGASLRRRKPHSIARLGVGHIPEGRGTFIDLSVEDNLKLACRAANRFSREATSGKPTPAEAFDLFPELGHFRARPAGALSGGQQQMLAICRALLARPSLLLIDEPCVGLAPKTSAEVFQRLKDLIGERRVSVLLAEQNVARAAEIANRAYVVSSGNIVMQRLGDQLADNDLVRAAYFGERQDRTPEGPVS